jgi:hypothetical protein
MSRPSQNVNDARFLCLGLGHIRTFRYVGSETAYFRIVGSKLMIQLILM